MSDFLKRGRLFNTTTATFEVVTGFPFGSDSLFLFLFFGICWTYIKWLEGFCFILSQDIIESSPKLKMKALTLILLLVVACAAASPGKQNLSISWFNVF